jgi:hypothetical protein
MTRLKKSILVFFFFVSSIYSEDFNIEPEIKKLKHYFNSTLLLSYSLYNLSEANGHNNNAINLQNTRSDLYALGVIAYQNQSQLNQERSIINTWVYTDMQTSRIDHYNHSYHNRLSVGIFFGVLGAISFYLDFTRIDKNYDLKPQSTIIPFFNWNPKSSEIGVSYRF